ncbi:MAG: BlaI/MecI/CopY family transcriptional regulator [Oscillospiraceae bacterium]|nr:BlaI/MecI/CopY family transcriptional regulator [Oscillospiraceae bacterium]
MKETIRRLPDAELEVMQAIWACAAPVARTDIEEILFKTHPMAMTTLLTLLTRLHEKGFITIEKSGRRSYYTPKVSQEDYLASQSKSFVEKLCGGSMSAFATALCNSGLTKEELAELRDMLERGTL